MSKDALIRFLQSGNFRQAKAAARLGLRPEDVETRFLILDGLSADTLTVKHDVPEVTSVKLDGIPEGLFFQSWKDMLACRGYLDGAEVVLAISRFDGFLAQSSALQEFFGAWTAGMLHITYEDKVMGGIADPDATGVIRDTIISIPRFVKYLRERDARSAMALAETLRDRYCHQELAKTLQQNRIDGEVAAMAGDQQPALTNAESELFETIRLRMQREVDRRAELASMRNSYLQADRPEMVSAIDDQIEEMDAPLSIDVMSADGAEEDSEDDSGEEQQGMETEGSSDGTGHEAFMAMAEQNVAAKKRGKRARAQGRKGKGRARNQGDMEEEEWSDDDNAPDLSIVVPDDEVEEAASEEEEEDEASEESEQEEEDDQFKMSEGEEDVSDTDEDD